VPDGEGKRSADVAARVFWVGNGSWVDNNISSLSSGGYNQSGGTVMSGDSTTVKMFLHRALRPGKMHPFAPGARMQAITGQHHAGLHQLWFQDLHALVHGAGRDQDLRDVHFVGLESLADLLHAVEKTLVQDVPCAFLVGQESGGQLFRLVGVAFLDRLGQFFKTRHACLLLFPYVEIIRHLVAADFVIIPLQCEYFALEGLSLILQTISLVQKSMNTSLKVCGILFTMYDSRTKLAQEVVQQVTEYFKDKVFRTIVPRNVRLSEAPSHGQPICLYDPTCIGAKSYEALAAELIERVKAGASNG